MDPEVRMGLALPGARAKHSAAAGPFEAQCEGSGTPGRVGLTRSTLLAFTVSLLAGCSPEGPLGVVGAIVTAPITAPVMFVSARMHDREDFLQDARRNVRPLPAVDARSQVQARTTLEQALEQGEVGQGLYWQNDDDASGYAAGGVTVLATGQTDDGRRCREVLIETVTERRPTDQRVRTYCRYGAGWIDEAIAPGHADWIRTGTK